MLSDISGPSAAAGHVRESRAAAGGSERLADAEADAAAAAAAVAAAVAAAAAAVAA